MTRVFLGAICAAFIVTTTNALALDVRPMVRSDATGGSVTVAQASSGFQRWRESFRPRAYAAGIRQSTFDAAFQGITPDPQIIKLDRRQAEFTKPIWEYLDSAVSSARVTTGRDQAQRLSRTMAAIEKAYGVDSEVVLAVWGMETNYGSFRGNSSVIRSLATLAYDGRRRGFAEDQLIAAMKILQSGEVAPSQMKGSWAGAMGHTQFIPTSYLSYAQDFNRDGRRNVWSDDPTDALASTAAYLKRYGWTKGQPWGVEVRLPNSFNYANIDPKLWRSVNSWTQAGVRDVNGNAVRNYGEASLLAPAGARGPIFMVFNNFRVIKRYNNATSYAMGVGHLAHRIAGGRDFQAAWPRQDRALSRKEKMEIQQRLTARGFSTGGADGLIGANTMDAIRKYQRSQGLVPDGYASTTLLRRLRGS